MAQTGQLRCGVRAVEVRIPPLGLVGTLRIPDPAHALVIFVHGSGSGRLSPRNVKVAEALGVRGLATLLFDLLLGAEERDRSNVFNISLLAGRLVSVVHWIDQQPHLRGLPLGFFGASTGAAAALVATASLGNRVRAVVSRGGRPDLADSALEHVKAPTLLIVGGADCGVIELNEQAFGRLKGQKALEVVPAATHLFEEPGAMDQVVEHAAHWFGRYLKG